MPKFRVFKGHDAYVEYEAVIEATDSVEALELASSKIAEIDWKANGDVSEFDHFDVFEDRVEEILEDEDETVEEKVTISLSLAQRDMVLAGLRTYQEYYRSTELPNHLLNIATNNGTHLPLELEQIDKLCEEINRA